MTNPTTRYFLKYLLAFFLSLITAPLMAQEAPVTVTLTKAHKQKISQYLYASGTLRAWQATDLRTQVSGRVVSLKLQENGWVEQGQLLILLDDREPRSRLRQAEVSLREAQRLLERYQRLQKNQSISQDQLETQQAVADTAQAELLALQAEVERYRITAPFSGYLGEHNITTGMLLDSGSLITTLDDLSQLRVDFSLAERHLSLLKPGLPLQATTPAWEDQLFEGVLHSIGTRIDPVTRNLSLQGRLTNPQQQLRPGMLINLTLQARSREALLIPARSLTYDGQEKAVFVVNEKGIAQRRTVEVGATQAEWVEILSGLEAGEQLVDQGVVKVRNGIQVRTLKPDFTL